MSENTVINIVAFVSNPEKEWTPLEGKIVEEKSHDEILKMYEGWEPEVIQLLQVRMILPIIIVKLFDLH